MSRHCHAARLRVGPHLWAPYSAFSCETEKSQWLLTELHDASPGPGDTTSITTAYIQFKVHSYIPLPERQPQG